MVQVENLWKHLLQSNTLFFLDRVNNSKGVYLEKKTLKINMWSLLSFLSELYETLRTYLCLQFNISFQLRLSQSLCHTICCAQWLNIISTLLSFYSHIYFPGHYFSKGHIKWLLQIPADFPVILTQESSVKFTFLENNNLMQIERIENKNKNENKQISLLNLNYSFIFCYANIYVCIKWSGKSSL